MPETAISLCLLLLLTLASGYCSGSETALFSLSSLRVKTYEHSGDPRKKLIAKLLSRPRDLLVTVFMLNTLVNILLQNVASHMFGHAAGWGLKVGVPLFITLIFGEIIPKNIGLKNNAKLAYLAAPSIAFIHNRLRAVRKLTVAITHPISRILFFFLGKEKTISREELIHALETSKKQGVLNADEAKLVLGYLQLQDATVKEIMTPAEDILFYDIEEPISKLIHLFKDQECTRIPVCREGLENVLGILSAKQYFLLETHPSKGEDLLPHLDKAFYVPETTPARVLLNQMDTTGHILALGVDEYGSISGILTREDIEELVIGEIVDLRDDASLYTKSGNREIIASGKMELIDFNHLFKSRLESPGNMVSIGGWIIEELGEIPKGGFSFESHGFLFQILAADPNRIRRVYIRKLEP